MSTGEQAPAPVDPTLLERMETRYSAMRLRDITVRRFEREVRRHTNEMRLVHQLRKVARVAIREQERWLREEAAAQIRKEAGVTTIPGFISKRENAIEFRKKLNETFRIVQAETRAKLAASRAAAAKEAAENP